MKHMQNALQTWQLVGLPCQCVGYHYLLCEK